MSTRSMIGKLEKNGKVKAVYCHFDGYLQGVGLELITYFNTVKKVNKLLGEGALRCIEEGKFVSYNAYRGEKVEETVYNSVADFANYCQKDFGIEYTYLFVKDLGWLVMDNTKFFHGLREDMCTRDEYLWQKINR